MSSCARARFSGRAAGVMIAAALTVSLCSTASYGLEVVPPLAGTSTELTGLSVDALEALSVDLTRLPLVSVAAPDDAEETFNDLAKRWNVTPSEARFRLEAQPAFIELNAYLAREQGGLYAGGWVEQSTGLFHFGLTEQADYAVTAALTKAFPWPELLVFERRKMDWERVQAVGQRIRSGLSQLTQGTSVRIATVVVNDTEATGGLTVAYAESRDPRFEEHVAGMAAQEALAVEFEPNTTPPSDAACTSYNACTDTPAKAGLGIYTPFARRCTAGFNVTASGIPRQLTAGHCQTGLDEIHFTNASGTRGKKLGRFFGTPRDSGVDIDVAIYDMVAEYEAVRSSSVYRMPTSPNYPMYTSGPVGTGVEICTTGSSKGYACGPVIDTSRNGTTAFQARICRRGGDSGGPAYTLGNRAVGLLSQADNGNLSNASCTTVDTSYYVDINYMTSLLGVQLTLF